MIEIHSNADQATKRQRRRESDRFLLARKSRHPWTLQIAADNSTVVQKSQGGNERQGETKMRQKIIVSKTEI